MRDGEKIGLEQIRALVSASAEVAFEGQQRKEVYGWVERVLREQQYRQQGRAARGLLRQYVVKMTGLSRAQATRLIGRYLEQGTVAKHATGDTGSRNGTRAPTWNCWQGWMKRTRR
jgi:hypothetical protein